MSTDIIQTYSEGYEDFKTLHEALRHSNSVLLIEDNQTGVLVSCRVTEIRCSDEVLRRLGLHLDNLVWNYGTPNVMFRGHKCGYLISDDPIFIEARFASFACAIRGVITKKFPELIDGIEDPAIKLSNLTVCCDLPLITIAVVDNLEWLFSGLLCKGFPLNVKDEIGRTVLHIAAYSGNPAWIKRLVALGADIEAEDKEGRTPFQHAFDADWEPAFVDAGARRKP